MRRALRPVFPDEWMLTLAEIAVYLFAILIATGVYLSLHYDPSFARTTYDGAYAPLQGARVSEAYRSLLEISFEVEGGLLARQAHQWAANGFVAVLILQTIAFFFTGAFRRPGQLTWLSGVTALFATLLAGYTGYSLLDDLISGMGTAIGYSVAMSIPVVGPDLALLAWGAPFPGDAAFVTRVFWTHVLVLPVGIAGLLGTHLGTIVLRRAARSTDGRGRAVGLPRGSRALRSVALALGTTALVLLLGGFVQINPVWHWGPYEVGLSSGGAQPAWYLGWLIGALRLVPGFDVSLGGYTLVPNAFWGGALFPLIVFATLALWPWAERRVTGDRDRHDLPERPRDACGRTAFGAGLLTWVVLIFLAGSADWAFVAFEIGYTTQIWVYRALVVLGPIAAFLVTRRICRELRARERAGERA